MITTWLISASLGCLIIIHVLICIKEAREHLGRLLERFVLKYKSTIVIQESSLSQSKDGKTYFYYGVFPVMMISVGLVTGVDIYFYCKYHKTSSYNDKKFLYLFPIPYVAPSFFVVNFVMSVATLGRIFCWDKVKDLCNELWNKCKCTCCRDEQNCRNSQLLTEQDTPEEQTEQDTPKEQTEQDTPEEQAEQDTPKRQKQMERKEIAKQCCELVLTMLTLYSLFGVVYLFYHGFWMIIALVIYPGRILIGSAFIVPLILAVIPTWITAIKMAENLFDACNESACGINHKSCCINSKSCHRGCAWFALLVYEVVFWVLFIVILFYISRFLLGSIDSKNETVKLVLSYIIIGVASLILVWLNTDLVIYQKDSKENLGGQQQNNQVNMVGQQQQNAQQNLGEMTISVDLEGHEQ